ncbi:MAG TPA: hypothetical protein PL182_00185 [Pseudobdellovibrionaceae bacterium]|nr:hypothetical protein [Pseudobdellovibrionaceae bacterium]
MATVDEVFGVSKSPVLSYIEREAVDGFFRDALRTDKQVIVYGSSKQGKTALVEKHAPYENNIVVRCTPSSGIGDIYRAILREHGIEIVTEKEKSNSSEASLSVGAKFKAMIPLFGGGEANTSGQIKGGSGEKNQIQTIEFNLELPQDISELLKKVGSSKLIILENFHYLNNDLQTRLSFDLRTFQELGIRFVVLGVWREKNRLAQFNGDLLDRMTEVPVEPWSREDFEKVISKGCTELNVSFSEAVKQKIIENAFDSIGVVQELLKLTCKRAGVVDTASQTITISDVNCVVSAINDKVEDYSARHLRALESIAEGRKANKPKGDYTPLYLPYYVVRCFLNFDFEDVLKGIRRERLEAAIKEIHHRPDEVRPSDMSNLLHNFAILQSEKSIVPPIFDYDQGSRTMRVVDSTFYFFLRNANRREIGESLINPLESRV